MWSEIIRCAHGRARTAALVALAALVLAAPPALAVIIESGDGTGNTEAPPDDPGWRNVAYRASRSAVYLQDRWVITALHARAGKVTIDGEKYTMEPGSKVIVTNPDGTPTDLVLFRIDRKPRIPDVWISESRPATRTALVLIGQGFGRGEKVRLGGFSGFHWGEKAPMRWGTNEVSAHLAFGQIEGTETFAARFSIAGSKHEAIAARGDSGGAAFVRGTTRWELAGILLAVSSYPDQPTRMALYGNQTYIADLSSYRDEIHRIMQGIPAAIPTSEPEATP